MRFSPLAGKKTNPNKPNLSSFVSLCPRSLSSTPIGESAACSSGNFVNQTSEAADDIRWIELIIDSYFHYC